MEEIMAQSKDTKEKIREKIKKFAKMSSVDKEAMVHHHKKNLEALTQANTTALEVMKNITKLQSEYMRQTFEDFSGMMKQVTQAGPKVNHHDVWTHHSEKIKAHVNRTAEHGKGIAETIADTHTKIYEIFHNRASDAAKDIAKRQKKHTH
jgi:hypothetical protein